MSSLAVRKARPAAGTTPGSGAGPAARRRRIAPVPTLTLLLGAVYSPAAGGLGGHRGHQVGQRTVLHLHLPAGHGTSPTT
ncbi:hypothetical protein LV779_02305 [Streptomyces thinghirensis]|nr:hypothetical protein [Streptomyces thinghirensis]